VLTLLREQGIKVVRAGIGPIGKADVISAKANLDINELDSVIVGFNVGMDEDLELGKVKVFSDDVVYKLIEDLQEWRKERAGEIEKDRLLSLASVCKMEILHKYVFRNSNPAIFGVKVLGGSVKVGASLLDENGLRLCRRIRRALRALLRGRS
jgi:translation initiation factor 5B